MYMSVDQGMMNSDISYLRTYIVPIISTDHQLAPTNAQKLLHHRQDVCNSARRSTANNLTTFEQTLTFIEQLKRNQHRSITEMNHFADQLTKSARDTQKKTLTPQELSRQVNLKLEHLIRTRVIEKHRIINQTNHLPVTKSNITKQTPREHFNRSTLIYLNQSRETNMTTASTITTTANTTVLQDDFVDKESLGDNDDEAFEEMIEEENVTFIQIEP